VFSSQREERVAAPHVIALVEFDMRKMRVRLLLAHEVIRERMQELEPFHGSSSETPGISLMAKPSSDKCWAWALKLLAMR